MGGVLVMDEQRNPRNLVTVYSYRVPVLAGLVAATDGHNDGGHQRVLGPGKLVLDYAGEAVWLNVTDEHVSGEDPPLSEELQEEPETQIAVAVWDCECAC